MNKKDDITLRTLATKKRADVSYIPMGAEVHILEVKKEVTMNYTYIVYCIALKCISTVYIHQEHVDNSRNRNTAICVPLFLFFLSFLYFTFGELESRVLVVGLVLYQWLYTAYSPASPPAMIIR